MTATEAHDLLRESYGHLSAKAYELGGLKDAPKRLYCRYCHNAIAYDHLDSCLLTRLAKVVQPEPQGAPTDG